MQHIKCRCKHCHKTYYFCTYGNGPVYGTEEGCSMEYCGECQTAITKALSDIPVRFKPKFKEISPSFGIKDMLEKIKKKDEDEKKEKDYSFFPTYVHFGDEEGYDNVEVYTHIGKTFRVEWNDETPDDKHYFVEMEWDIEKKGYTGSHWEAKDYKDSYSIHKTYTRFMKQIAKTVEEINQTTLGEPSGLLWFNDTLDWSIITPKSEPRPKRHILNRWVEKNSGGHLKGLVEFGRTECQVVLADGITLEGVEDVLEYNTTHERYEDEYVEKITKIEIA